MDFILEKITNKPNAPLEEFFEMWYNVFLWAMFSSIFIHSVAAIIAFLTLRKHAVGRTCDGQVACGVMGCWTNILWSVFWIYLAVETDKVNVQTSFQKN
ncbi:hypothetical protein OUZ56_013482 [Daphnia magna]|uniref:Uncharacterized protein n=1 Tax=Daphnia magna TaxID=35525 RepID=A0ABQ9Z604_9CRUS|nr:hypothetical protein OUZ56_013482 [Daphnia magna]